jgi:hypothetical protein
MIPFLEIYGRPADSSASSVPQPEKWRCPPCVTIHHDGQSATTKPLLWIPIRSDRHHAGGPRSMVSISTISKAKLYFVPVNFNILSKLLKIITSMTMTKKNEQCTVNWHKFSNMWKTWGRARIGIEMKSRIRVRILSKC